MRACVIYAYCIVLTVYGQPPGNTERKYNLSKSKSRVTEYYDPKLFKIGSFSLIIIYLYIGKYWNANACPFLWTVGRKGAMSTVLHLSYIINYHIHFTICLLLYMCVS